MVSETPFIHHPKVVAPWYLSHGGTALHRYLDDEFVDRFLDDLHADRLGALELTAWQGQDFFGGRRDYVSLRQPLHRAYYLVSVEVVCDRLGFPAFDRARIRSAGYVIRRVPRSGNSQSWQVKQGRAVGGWVPTLPGVDPDEARRSPSRRNPLTISGKTISGKATTAATREPPYSGEQVHPLHIAELTDATGKRRTVLFGFLAIAGGTALITTSSAAKTPVVDTKNASEAALKQLAIPFGTSSQGALYRTKVVEAGHPSHAFLSLLQLMVQCYRLGLDTDAANDEIADELRTWYFDQAQPKWSGDIPANQRLSTTLSVYDWIATALTAQQNPEAPVPTDGERASLYRPLLHYLGLHSAENAGPTYLQPPLPGTPGESAYNLHCDSDRAARIKAILLRRAAALVNSIAREIPVPRFAQGDDDIYVALPFVRYCCGGQEEIRFGPATQCFRVASAYSAEASRPTLIPLPSLADLMGKPTAGFLAPQDLARKLLGLKQDGDSLKFKDGDGPTFGICWLFNFSIPAITICAFILLSIILGLLNLIFWWLPFVFLKIPFLCRLLPPPKPEVSS